ncbi:MAG TPA: hypothetical protein VFW65_31775 [Pseudonocardiaceae bacterium]|nr:hypothetical protein [Pseudonocardiaceae bacterium]
MVEQGEHPTPAGTPTEAGPGTGTAPATEVLDEDERAELIRLRQENTALRRARQRRRQVPWRAFAAAVLIVLGVILAPISVASIWAHNQIANTDRFVATAGPLAEDPAVQSALTDRLTDTVFTYVNVVALTNQAVDALESRGLPPRAADRLRGLAVPLRSSLQGFVHDKVGQFVASAAFAQLWNRSLTVVHQQLNSVLSGNSSAVTVSQGKVMLDLGPFIDRVKQRLVAEGFAPANAIPSVHPTVAVADASTLVRAQTGYRLLDKVATWLPWLTLLLLAAGIYLARGHRKALRNAGLGVAFSMLVLGAVLLIARGAVVGTVPERSTAAVASSFDIMVAFLRAGLRTIFVVGIVVAIGASLFGPSTTAVRIRQGAVGAVGWLREHIPVGGRQGGPVGAWVHTYRVPLRVAVLVIGVLIFLFLNQPSGVAVIVIAAILVVLLGVIQFLDRPAPHHG